MSVINLVINDVEVPEIEFAQLRVLTLKMIDKIHGRPDGTALRNFKSNRQYFVENEDYFSISRDEFRPEIFVKFGFGAQSTNGILISESGYLLLVKSFTDDLAWRIQKELIRGYFRTKIVSVDFKFADWDKNRLRISNIASRLPHVSDSLELKMLWGELQDRCSLAGLPTPDFKLIGKDYRQATIPGFDVEGLENLS